MIHLITATPGGGKTLRAVQMIIEQYLKGDSPRPVYTNIEGFKRGLPLPEDWRDTPDGSLIVIDEVQQVWPAHSASKKAPADAEALDMHRHTGHDFILMTQHPTLLSHKVRAFVQVHEHLTRKGGMNVSFGHRWEGRCANNPASEFKSADVEHFTWVHPKRYYGEYKSASVHNVKRRLPKALKLAIFVIPAAAASVVYAVQSVKEDLSGGLSPEQQEQASQAAASAEPVTIRPPDNTAMATGGIRQGNEKCVLIGEDSRILNTRRSDCLNAHEIGFPTRVEVL